MSLNNYLSYSLNCCYFDYKNDNIHLILIYIMIAKRKNNCHKNDKMTD